MDTAGEQADAAVSRLQEYVEQLGIRLQDGWRAEVVTRKEGRSIGTKDTYYYAPDGRRFRSRREVAVQLSLGVGSKDPDGGVIGLKRPLDELPHAPKRPRRSTSNQDVQSCSTTRPRCVNNTARTSWKRKCRSILHSIMQNRDAWPFLEPVSKAQAPDYLEVVQRPMDLGTVLRRLDDDHYTSPEAMFNDTLLVFDNAQVYNASEHLIHQMAKDLKNVFQELWATKFGTNTRVTAGADGGMSNGHGNTAVAIGANPKVFAPRQLLASNIRCIGDDKLTLLANAALGALASEQRDALQKDAAEGQVNNSQPMDISAVACAAAAAAAVAAVAAGDNGSGSSDDHINDDHLWTRQTQQTSPPRGQLPGQMACTPTELPVCSNAPGALPAGQSPQAATATMDAAALTGPTHQINVHHSNSVAAIDSSKAGSNASPATVKQSPLVHRHQPLAELQLNGVLHTQQSISQAALQPAPNKPTVHLQHVMAADCRTEVIAASTLCGTGPLQPTRQTAASTNQHIAAAINVIPPAALNNCTHVPATALLASSLQVPPSQQQTINQASMLPSSTVPGSLLATTNPCMPLPGGDYPFNPQTHVSICSPGKDGGPKVHRTLVLQSLPVVTSSLSGQVNLNIQPIQSQSQAQHASADARTDGSRYMTAGAPAPAPQPNGLVVNVCSPTHLTGSPRFVYGHRPSDVVVGLPVNHGNTPAACNSFISSSVCASPSNLGLARTVPLQLPNGLLLNGSYSAFNPFGPQLTGLQQGNPDLQGVQPRSTFTGCTGLPGQAQLLSPGQISSLQGGGTGGRSFNPTTGYALTLPNIISSLSDAKLDISSSFKPTADIPGLPNVTASPSGQWQRALGPVAGSTNQPLGVSAHFGSPALQGQVGNTGFISSITQMLTSSSPLQNLGTPSGYNPLPSNTSSAMFGNPAPQVAANSHHLTSLLASLHKPQQPHCATNATYTTTQQVLNAAAFTNQSAGLGYLPSGFAAQPSNVTGNGAAVGLSDAHQLPSLAVPVAQHQQQMGLTSLRQSTVSYLQAVPSAATKMPHPSPTHTSGMGATPVSPQTFTDAVGYTAQPLPCSTAITHLPTSIAVNTGSCSPGNAHGCPLHASSLQPGGGSPVAAAHNTPTPLADQWNRLPALAAALPVDDSCDATAVVCAVPPRSGCSLDAAVARFADQMQQTLLSVQAQNARACADVKAAISTRLAAVKEELTSIFKEADMQVDALQKEGEQKLAYVMTQFQQGCASITSQIKSGGCAAD
eukprot:jgi/Chrzof1/14416/Cz09g02040.t1